MKELEFLDKKYGSLAFRAHFQLDGARYLAWLCGVGTAVAVAGWQQTAPKWLLVLLPLLASAASTWVIRRHDLLKLRASAYNAYHALLNRARQHSAYADGGPGLEEVHTSILDRMEQIAKDQEDRHLSILAPAVDPARKSRKS
jgi:hypothetical protein